VDFQDSIFFGQPIVEAYELSEDQQWYGVAEHENCEPKQEGEAPLAEIQSDEVSLSEAYYVPLKSDNRDLCVLNWPVFIESEAAVEEAFSPFKNCDSPKLHMYYQNTNEFALIEDDPVATDEIPARAKLGRGTLEMVEMR
jgi:hypothetical protein